VADFQDVKIVPLGNGNINAHPRYRLEFRMCESTVGQPTMKHPRLNTDLDFTGATKGIVFPDCLKLLTEEQRLEVLEMLWQKVAYKLNEVG
jgi:hypothetical protein